MSATETSAATFQEITASGLVTKLQRLVIQTMRDTAFSREDFTPREVAAEAGVQQRDSLSPRFAELARLDVVEKTRKRKCSISGSVCWAWKLTGRVPKKPVAAEQPVRCPRCSGKGRLPPGAESLQVLRPKKGDLLVLKIAKGSMSQEAFEHFKAGLKSPATIVVANEGSAVDLHGEARAVVEGLVRQFAFWSNGKTPGLHHGGYSALEDAFDFLGWGMSAPHPMPDMKCQTEGCNERQTCGFPDPTGYKNVCGKHFTELQRQEEAAADQAIAKAQS